MPAIHRLISGSAAAWFSIFISLCSQILLVPIFLSRWSAEVYGVWLAITALSSLILFIDNGHHNYLGNEFLRLGKNHTKEISKTYYSALPIAIALSFIELLIIITIVHTDWHIKLFGITGIKDTETYTQAGTLLILNSIIWLAIGNWSTIAGRLLAAFGYYPRIAWWQVFGAIMTTTTTAAVIVIMDGNLLTVGIAYQLAYIFYAILIIIDILHKLKKEQIIPVYPDYLLGLLNLKKSLAISLKTLLEMVRQQHIRLIIAPLAGALEMVVFVTTRTCANILFQGLGTVTNPLMPELMRFLREKNQGRSEAAICFVWLFLIIILVPSAITAQWIMPDIFSIWTRNKVEYNPILFAFFSQSVLIFALAQPAMAVVQGNNLLRPQIWISILTTATTVIGIITLFPIFGITGAGFALMSAELLAAICYIFVAKKWLYIHKISWPQNAFIISVMSVLLGGIVMIFLTIMPDQQFFIMLIGFVLTIILMIYFWQSYPIIGKQYAYKWFYAKIKKPHS